MSPEHEQLNDSLINSAQLTKVYYAVCRFAHRGGFFQPSGAINLQVCRYQLEARPIFTAWTSTCRAQLTRPWITRFRAVAYPKSGG